MAITTASAVNRGDYIWIKDHHAQPRFRDYWWKVVDAPIIGASDTFPLLVNRHGERARYTSSRAKVYRWEPGDDRRDPKDQ